MTVLHPCHNCHRKADCSIRAKTLAKMKGSAPKVTKATIACKIPQLDFPAGAVVDVSAFELLPGHYMDDGYRKSPVTRRGIVMMWLGRKAMVALDCDQEIEKPEEDAAIGILKVTSDRLTATGLPPVELCSCGLSQQRCDAGDYPSVRGGKFRCGS